MGAMMSRRPPSDGDSSRIVAIPSVCRAIGAQLAETRDARRLTVEQIASELMLSRSQVLGLERADASPFYSSAYFMRGLRKYMAYASVPDDELNETLAEEHEEDGFRLMLAEPMTRTRATSPLAIPTDAIKAAAIVAAIAAAVTVLGIGAYRYYPAVVDLVRGTGTVALATEAPLPAHSTAEPQMSPAAVRAVPTSGVLPVEDSTVRISVGKATWVFIRYPDNRVIERRLEAGEAMQIGPLPAYLAVGTADSVELRVEDRPVSLKPYIRDGQVRITQPELAKLIP
jgi:transcriptional regulator with XRE-family HTH domain